MPLTLYLLNSQYNIEVAISANFLGSVVVSARSIRLHEPLMSLAMFVFRTEEIREDAVSLKSAAALISTVTAMLYGLAGQIGFGIAAVTESSIIFFSPQIFNLGDQGAAIQI
jgi:hypothetical protein